MFIPLGGGLRVQCLSRLAAICGPSVWPAWRRFAGPVFVPLGGGLRAQCLSRLAAVSSPGFIPLGSGLRTQYLSRLAVVCEPSIYPAWREPRFYLAWRPSGRSKASHATARFAHAARCESNPVEFFLYRQQVDDFFVEPTQFFDLAIDVAGKALSALF